MELRLSPTADIALATLKGRKPGAVALGFALETEDLMANARRKMKEKGFDLIAANSALEEGAGFDVDTNRVTILDTEGGVEALPLLPKEEVAEKLLDRLTPLCQGGIVTGPGHSRAGWPGTSGSRGSWGAIELFLGELNREEALELAARRKGRGASREARPRFGGLGPGHGLPGL